MLKPDKKIQIFVYNAKNFIMKNIPALLNRNRSKTIGKFSSFTWNDPQRRVWGQKADILKISKIAN